MSFKFRLQRILELRAQAEQAKARELAAARNLAEQAEAAQQALEALRDDSQAQIHAAALSSPRVGHLQQLGTVLDALDVRLERAAELVKAAEADVQQAQLKLEDAARDRRVLDRLKERHADAWKNEMAQKDRVQMDEIALLQFARKQEMTNTAAEKTMDSASPTNGTAQ